MQVKERLTTPLVNGKESTWDAATKLVAEKLNAADKNTVVLASGRLSNEDLYNLKSLAGGLGGKAVLYTDMGGGDLVAQVGVGELEPSVLRHLLQQHPDIVEMNGLD